VYVYYLGSWVKVGYVWGFEVVTYMRLWRLWLDLHGVIEG